jgi:hypothetical protein
MWNVRIVELRAGLADRLRGDDADRFADVDEMPARKIAPVARGADAEARFARDRRAHHDRLHAGRLELLDHRFVEQRVARDDRILVVAGRERVGRDHAAEHAIAQRLDHVAAFDDRRHRERAVRAAIGLGDDHVLRDVDETAREVARVRGLERGIGEAFARTVRRVEVLKNVQPSRKFALIGVSMIEPSGRAMRPRMPAS